MPGLRELQATFAAALEGGEAGSLEALVLANGIEPGLRIGVYRNNGRLTRLEALAGIYPAMQRLLGEEFFAHVADLYAALHPSRSGDLRRFGERLAGFLESFPPTASLAYLPDVARLEWAWHEAFHAPFSSALDEVTFAQVSQAQRQRLRLALRPGARLLRSDFAAAKVWEFALGDHAEGAPRLDLAREAQSHVLVVRPELEVLVVDLEPAEWLWLEALCSGSRLGEAGELVRAGYPGADPDRYLSTHLALGSLSRLI